ncbi:TerD family protein [Cellulomonas fimi]|uniref:Stress protein n=1 Tax=Cellulomonas fimi (strain ATCC 484 / DSM 20113 / JCM 1341 / CCUG 24087 / LMG 16345 / NBRC 15513 / NCIMB 8980 / NCTC 7547 / NRS-133) TaxID=590998 RepID=F4H7K3_CELFA|nr:TerD family protein [Cellulomonas fimi]AEE44560.1 stress protein [Cellulomonas fimi ATCC 484]NNH06464.1 stress protein [Cellulomonas fimi]VEH26623.1 General stress protein 16U [Cellulomonas fimi]
MSSPLELAKGQNAPWPDAGLLVEVVGAAVADCDVSVLLVDERQRVASSDDFVFYNQPSAPGATLEPGTPARVRLTLAAVPARVHAVLCLVSVDAHRPPLGALPPLTAVLRGADGTERARFALAGLTSERAVVAVEVYRRGPAWKVRAVGQGYDGGLAQAVTEHGVDVDDDAPAAHAAPAAPAAHGAAPPPAPAPAAMGPTTPPGTSDGERLLRHAAAIFEDAARSTAALRSSVGYADGRRDEALAALVADPRLRGGPEYARAAATAERERDDLVAQARARHDADLRQLGGELATFEARLPAAMAPWASGAWRGWRPPTVPSPAVRVGELHVEEAPTLRFPMLLGLPLSQPLWVDTATGTGAAAVRMVRALVTRLLAAHPAGGLEVHVVDLTGGLAPSLAALAQPGSRVMTTPAATSVAAAAGVLDALVRRVDLVQMARSAGAMDALDGAGGARLLVLHDFPTALDDAAVGRVRYLVDEGPASGVQVLLTGERSPVLDGSPLVTTLFRESLRLPVEPDDHIADGWTGTQWRYTPDLGPDDATVLDGVLRAAAGTDRA